MGRIAGGTAAYARKPDAAQKGGRLMMQTLLPYMSKYMRYAILAPLMIVVEVICELVLPRIMAAILDVGVANQDVPYIVKMGVLMVALAVSAIILGFLSSKFSATCSQGFGAELRKGMFDKVQDFSFADIDRFSSASLITRMTNDVNNLTMMISMGLRILTRAPVMLVVAMVLTFYISGEVGLVLVVIIPIMAVAIGLLMMFCSKLFALVQTKIDNLNNTVQENLVAVRVVKAFVRAGYEKTKFLRVNDALTAANLQVGMRIVLMLPIMLLSLNIATLSVLWVGGQNVMGGTLSIGDLNSCISYITQILFSVIMLAMALLQFSRAQACARRICEVLDTEPSIEDGAVAKALLCGNPAVSALTGETISGLPAPAGRVEFLDVTFRYTATGTGDDVLAKINLTIEPGQLVAIVGGTGVGKSTLVSLIPRFYDVTAGSVRVDGLDVREYPLDKLRSRIGMVLQNNLLFSGTIRENLMWGRADATEEEMIQAAKDAQAYEFVTSFPDGFDTWLEQGGVNVSGGQKQRLCIARAMLRKPAILILDDSTSAVDSATEASIRESFQRNLKGTTVIIIAQRVSSVQYADRIIILEDDHIAGIGDHATLLESNQIYQEIYQSQLEGVRE